MKVLFVVGCSHFLLEPIYSEFEARDIQFVELSLTSIAQRIRYKRLPKKLKNLFALLHIFIYLCFNYKKFDVVSYHYATLPMKFIDVFAQLMKIPRVLTVWGSEYYRADNRIRKKLKVWYRKIDRVSVANETLFEELKRDQINLVNLPFGLPIIDRVLALKMHGYSVYQAKLDLGFFPDRLTLVVGTNASRCQQHSEILNQLLLIDYFLKDRCQLIFPLTYGDELVREEVLSKIKNLKTPSICMIKKLSDRDNAKLRIATDILIQLQTSDQLSGAMLETLYAGGEIVTGSWLPYSTLDRLGLKMHKIDSVNSLFSVLRQLVQENNWRSCISAVAAIAQRYSVSAVSHEWVRFVCREWKC